LTKREGVKKKNRKRTCLFQRQDRYAEPCMEKSLREKWRGAGRGNETFNQKGGVIRNHPPITLVARKRKAIVLR